MNEEESRREIIGVLLEKARDAADNLDVYQVSRKTKVKSVSGKTDDREETVVDTEELETQRLEGCVDVARLRQLIAGLKDLEDMDRRDDDGRLNELMEALWSKEEGKVKK